MSKLRAPAEYRAFRCSTGCVVSKWDGVKTMPLWPRLDLRNHSPNGFEWGCCGSGPAQLALAILADAIGEEGAVWLYERFKAEVVARLPKERWAMAVADVRRWANAG